MTQATTHVRRMRGGAQSQLMLASDGHPYVVKFQNNPQHLRVLANEWFATGLAQRLDLSVPDCEIIEVDDALIRATKDMTVSREKAVEEPCLEGRHFGSRLVGGLMPGRTVDYLPENFLMGILNIREFLGMLAFDKWTDNADGRQAVFWKETKNAIGYTAMFIDHGYCFNAGEWQRLKNAPLRSVYARNIVYRDVVGWDSFEPWLSAIETFSPENIWLISHTIPMEWCGNDSSALEQLVERLIKRRGRVRELIAEFQKSSRNPFPNWN